MNHIKPIIKSALWLLPWLCTVPFTSCSFEDDLAICDNGTATLQVTVNAREEGDLNSRATTETGTTGEFMSDNLIVLLVDNNGNVVLKLAPDLTSNTAAQAGNLKTWISDEITIDTGTYTAYAFANIDDYYYTNWNTIIETLKEGSTLTEATVNAIVLEDPAGKIDFENKHYIPLSAKQQVAITSGTRSISIGLDRLVSKVRAKVTGKAGLTVSELTFGGYADKVTLIPDEALTDETYNTVKTVKLATGSNTLTIDGDGTASLTIPDFYVNESRDRHPFTVNVTTNENNGTTYIATTTTDELLRNYIFPLTLNLNEYRLNIEATCWLAPIGAPKTKVTPANEQQDTYNVTIPAGSTFEFEVNTVGGIIPTSCTWTLTEDCEGYIAFDNEQSSVTGLTATGYSSAEDKGDTYTIKINVSWTDSGSTYNRTYTLEVTTDPNYSNFTFVTTNANAETKAISGIVHYLDTEILNMFIK